MFTRIMVDRLRYRYAKERSFPLNQFLTNYIYHESFESNFGFSKGGSVLGIPSPTFPLDGDGAMDPRVFQHGGKLYLIVLLFTYLRDKLWKPHPVIWDVEEQRCLTPFVNLTYDEKKPMEKNWTPLVVNNTLYLVYNVDPLRVLGCDLLKQPLTCSFVHDQFKATDGEGFTFQRRTYTLRGGTPFVLYEWPYYISLAHSVVICMRPDAYFGKVRRYEANIVVMRADLGFRVVYVSSALQFNPDLFNNASLIHYAGQILVENDFVYPVSIIQETNDRLVVGSHLNDRVSAILRLEGLRGLMQEIKAKGSVTRRNVDPLKVQQFVKKHFPCPQES